MAKTEHPGTVVESTTAPSLEPESRVDVASQWKLMWWRFRRHKLAVVGTSIVALIYLTAIFAGFLAPYTRDWHDAQYTYAPPQRLHVGIGRDSTGRMRLLAWVYGYQVEARLDLGRRVFTLDHEQTIAVRLLAEGEPYTLLGLFNGNVHLIGPADPSQPAFFLGADKMGRCNLSRIIYGTQTSMSLGMVGVFLSLFLGVFLGGLSGYYGGVLDRAVQRVIEFLRTIPSIPLWMSLAAAIPLNWSVTARYFCITIILSLIGWTGLARVVRGRFLALKTEDFVLAARFDGCSAVRIVLRHMVPSFLSHIIASMTLSIPHMILSETSLSFLGLGLRPPAVSWGVLLQTAQNVRTVSLAPWLLAPAFAVIVAVLSLNFMGDGLRDASDPYG